MDATPAAIDAFTYDADSRTFAGPDLIFPAMKAIFGVSEQRGFFSLTLQFDVRRPEHAACLRFIEAFDAKFGPSHENYRSIIRRSGRWPPNVTLKLPVYRNGEFLTKVFGHDPDHYLASPPECIARGDSVIAVVEVGSLWTSATRHSTGVNWNAIQIRLTQTPRAGIYSWL